MPATDLEKMQARLLLGLTLTDVSAPADALTATEYTEFQSILTQAEKAKFRAADLNGDGVSVTAEATRRVLRDRLAVLLGIASPLNGYVGTVIPTSNTLGPDPLLWSF